MAKLPLTIFDGLKSLFKKSMTFDEILVEWSFTGRTETNILQNIFCVLQMSHTDHKVMTEFSILGELSL